MLVALLGIVAEVRLSQQENAFLPIIVMPSGTVTEVRPLQQQNAPSPMLATLPGMVTDVRLEQPLNALPAIFVTLIPSSCVDLKRFGLSQIHRYLRRAVLEHGVIEVHAFSANADSPSSRRTENSTTSSFFTMMLLFCCYRTARPAEWMGDVSR